ncbi:MAG: hypothetical protein Q7R92_03630 [bacterium]|nr:hypothetical protein [bacterium]
MAKKPTSTATPTTPPATTATPPTPVVPVVVLPTPTATTPAAALSDPVELQLLKSELPNRDIRIFARVLNIVDKGLGRKQVVFTRDGEQKVAITNSQGDTMYPDPITPLPAGKETKVSAHISGIRNFSVMHIIKRVVKTPAQMAKDRRNNKIAKYFILFMGALWLASWLIAFIFGLGNPLIDFSQTKLSDQQVFFNNLPGVKGSAKEIKLDQPQSLGQWQKPFFLAVLLWTIFCIFYGILACREEAMEGFRKGIEKLVDKHYNTASARDPFFERLLAFSGHLATAKRPTSTTATPAGSATTPPTNVRPSFWELFRSDILSDLIVEVLPSVIKSVRGR